MITTLYVDAEKDYLFLCLKKWYAFSAKEELIPQIEVEFYLTDSTKVTRSGVKKATRIEMRCDDRRANELSFEVYRERFVAYLKETFVKVY